MKIDQSQARQLVNNPAFAAVFEGYIVQIFAQWKSEQDPEQRERLWLKGQVANEVKTQLMNATVDIDGHRTATDSAA